MQTEQIHVEINARNGDGVLDKFVLFLTFPAAVFKNTDVQLLFQKSMQDCKGEGKLLQVINRRGKVHLPPCKLFLPFEFRIMNSFSKFNLLRQTAVTVMNSK